MTQYAPSMLIAERRRTRTWRPASRSASASSRRRSCGSATRNPVQLGHHATADGRWRIYVFADAGGAAGPGASATWSQLARDRTGVAARRATPAGAGPRRLVRREGDLPAGPHERRHRRRARRCSCRASDRSGSSTMRRSTRPIRRRTSSTRAASTAAAPSWSCVPTSTWRNVLPLTATSELAAFFTPILSRS